MAKKAYVVLKLKDEFSKPLKVAEKGTKEYEKTVTLANKRLKKFSTTLKNDVAKAAATASKALGAASIAVVTAGVKYNAQMQDYMSNFKVMLGSEEEATKKVNELKKMAAKTPFEMGDLADGTKTLLAFGIESDKTTDTLRMIGDVSLGNAEKMKSLANAYGKVASQGKLTGQELNMMIDAGFNPLNLIAEKTGESMEELRKRMSKGEISVKEVEDAFKKATSEGGQFYKGMEEGSNTFNGRLSTIKDNLSALAGTISGPIFDALTNTVFPKAIAWLEKVQEQPEMITNKINALLPVVGAFASALAAFKIINTISNAIKVWKGVTQAYAIAQGLANTTMLASPLTWIVIGIAAVVAAAIALWRNWDKVCAFAGKLKEKLKVLIKPIEKIVGVFQSLVGWVKDTVLALKDFLGLNTNKKVTVETENNVTTKGKDRKPSKGPRHALGTTYFAGGLTGFSEGGRAEQAIFPSGTQIIPADKVGKNDNKSITVNLTIQGNVIGNKAYMEEVGNYIAKRVSIAAANI